VNVISALKFRYPALFLLLVVLFTGVARGAPSGADSARFYEELRRFYRQRISSFNDELSAREALLTGKFRSIIREVKKRPQQRFGEEFFTDRYDQLVAHEAFPSDLVNTINLPRKVEVWMHQQRRILEAKELKADNLRQILMDTADNEQLLRMFRYDLELAAGSYAHEDWRLAVLRFEDILKNYPFGEMDDVYFYLAESYYAQQMYRHADHLFCYLLENYPGTVYAPAALDHLLYARLSQRNFTSVTKFRESHAALFKRTDDPVWDEIFFMVGLAYYNLENYEEAAGALIAVSDKSNYRLRKLHLLASCHIFRDRGDEAITILEQLGTMATDGNVSYRETYIRDDANIKLGYLYFERGDYQRSLEAFNRISDTSGNHDYAILGRAWAELQIGDAADAGNFARELIRLYPGSRFIFEAYALRGYSLEVQEQPDSARFYYQHLLKEGDRFTDLQEISSERKRIIKDLKKINSLEYKVFEQEDVDGYRRYLDLRQELFLAYQRVRYAQLRESNDRMADFIAERKAIIDLKKQLQNLLPQALDDGNSELIDRVDQLRRTSRRLDRSIKLAGLLEIRKNPIVQQESETGYLNSILGRIQEEADQEYGNCARTAPGSNNCSQAAWRASAGI